MRYIHWRDDFSITESFSEDGHSVSVPQRVRIEYFTARGHNRFVVERNGDTFVNCELSGGGSTLTVHLSLRDNPIGHGRLLRIATVITQDSHFPNGLKYNSYPGKLEAILYFGKSDGPLDIASEIVFDGVDRLSLLQDVDLSNPVEGDLLSWKGSRWANIPQSAIRQDLSDYVRWESLSDYVTKLQLQELIGFLPSTDELSSLSDRVTALEDVSFFTLDTNGNITLKEQYQNLWVPGWLAAGGVGNGSGGGGGGGGATYMNDLEDVTAPNPATNDLLRWNGTAWVNVPQSQIAPSIGFTDLTSHPTTLSGYGITNAYTKSQVDALIADIDLSGYVTSAAFENALSDYATLSNLNAAVEAVNVLESITTQQDGTVDFEWKNGNIVKVDFNHEHSNYVPITRTINGVDLSQNRTFYTLRTELVATPANGVLYGVDAISNGTPSVSPLTDDSRIVWEPNAGGSGIGAWHFLGNIYADGWVSAGGIGQDGGGGGGGASSLYDLPEVGVSSPQTGQFFYYDGSQWVNTPIKTINGNSLIGSGNITIQGGGPLSPATATDLGGIIVGSVISTPTLESISTTTNRYYQIQCDANGKAFVNVPWTGGGGGSGTLTSVGLDMPSCFSVSGSPLQSDGAITVSFSSQTRNYVLAAPATANGTPSFRALVASDIPALNYIQSHQSVTLASGTNNGTLKLTTAAGTVDNIAVKGLGSLAYKSSLATTDIPNLSGTYVTLSGSQEIVGPKTFKTNDVTLQGVSLIPTSSSTCYLGGQSSRFSTVYSVNGNLSGHLTMQSGSTIKIGPATISYDDNAMALRVSGVDPMSDATIGFYCEGWVSAGGVGTNANYELSSNKVTSLSSASTHDEYPSAKCVYDLVGNIESLLAAI